MLIYISITTCRIWDDTNCATGTRPDFTLLFVKQAHHLPQTARTSYPLPMLPRGNTLDMTDGLNKKTVKTWITLNACDQIELQFI